MEHFGLFSIRCPIEPFSTKNTGLHTGNDIDYKQYLVFKYTFTMISYWQWCYDYYRKVNEIFATATLTALRRSIDENRDQCPIIWIHDYHLMLAANTIRQV